MSKIFGGLEVGRRYTWNEIVSALPNMWVVMKDCNIDGADIVDGVLVDAADDDNWSGMLIKYVGTKCECQRTTDNHFGGVVELDGYHITVE